MGKKQEEGPKTEAFVIPEKVEAFCNAYEPADKFMPDVEVFYEARLRSFFKAYVTVCGDPLKNYVKLLSDAGFKFSVTITGQPAILVRERICDTQDNYKLR